MRSRRLKRGRRARWKRRARQVQLLHPEVFSDPELRTLAARLRLAVDGLDHPDASKWLLELGLDESKGFPFRRTG